MVGTLVTPDEPVKIQPEDKDWKAFEKDVANLTSRMDSGTESIEHDAGMIGELSGVPRQIDVLVKGQVGGSQLSIAIECKKHARPVDVTHIDKFIGMLLDLPVDSGVFYAFGPVTAGARDRAANARHPKVKLRELAELLLVPVWSEELDELVPWGDCQAPGCCAGVIQWLTFPQEDGDDIFVGSCYFCGTWTIRCRDCEEEEYAVTSDVTCMSCGAEYQLVSSDYQSTDWDGVRQTTQGEA